MKVSMENFEEKSPALRRAVHPFCSRSLCHNAAILVTPASVRGMGQSEAECLKREGCVYGQPIGDYMVAYYELSPG